MAVFTIEKLRRTLSLMRIWLVIFLFLLCSSNNFGQIHAEEDWKDEEASQLQLEFEKNLSSMSKDLAANYSEYIGNPKAFDTFINLHIAKLWDVQSTTRALLGKSFFKKLSKYEKDGLVSEVEKTWRRYAHEALKYYDGQSFAVSDVVINKTGTRAWVKIVMEAKLLPDIYFDILIKRDGDEPWRAVDARFQGITYVSIKKHQFREIVEAESILALEAHLSKNNEDYFSELCRPINLKGSPLC